MLSASLVQNLNGSAYRAARMGISALKSYSWPWNNTLAPQSVVNSIQDWVTCSNPPKDTNYTSIYPAQIFHRSLPDLFIPPLEPIFKQAAGDIQQPGTFVLELENARVWSESGAVITQQNELLLPLSVEMGQRLDNHSLLHRKTLPSPRSLPGTAALLSVTGGSGYFHWMTDLLPRIQLLKQIASLEAIDHFIVSRNCSSFQRETLAYLGIPDYKIIDGQLNPHLQAKKLFVPSLPSATGHTPKWACDFLKQVFLHESSTTPPHRRLYISRCKARRRRVVNEADLTTLLKSKGFESMILEDFSVLQQAELFAEAEVIIAPHGAALTNIVFCSPKVRIIELFCPDYINLCYWSLSGVLGTSYGYLIGRGGPAVESRDHNAYQLDMEISVSQMAKLLTMLKL